MDADASDGRIDAQCRLLADFHATVPLEIAAARMRHATNPPRVFGGSPFRHELRKTGRCRPRIPPAIYLPKSPCTPRTLARQREKANSRFFTDCYLFSSHFVPFYP